MADTGPVVVTVEYRIEAPDIEAFLLAMRELRRIRRRDGARRWTLMQDVADPEVWIERYHSPNWVEHLRRHHRFTVADQEIERRALAFHRGDSAPRVRHFIERPPTEALGERAAGTDPNLPSASAALTPSAPGEG
jgi:quinol monooxygenase YgiN